MIAVIASARKTSEEVSRFMVYTGKLDAVDNCAHRDDTGHVEPRDLVDQMIARKPDFQGLIPGEVSCKETGFLRE